MDNKSIKDLQKKWRPISPEEQLGEQVLTSPPQDAGNGPSLQERWDPASATPETSDSLADLQKKWAPEGISELPVEVFPTRIPMRRETPPEIPMREVDERVPRDMDSFFRGIGGVESGAEKDPYKAQNPKSSAVGKYQFLWGTWGSEIAKFARKPLTKEDFKNDPDLQENFARHYYKQVLIPQAAELEEKYGHRLDALGATDVDDAKRLIHYLGPKGAEYWARTGDLLPKQKEDNMEPLAYLRKARLRSSR